MTYEDKITRLNPEEFFSLFEDLHAEPRWVNSRGKQSIQVLGLCHHGENHSALFDPRLRCVRLFWHSSTRGPACSPELPAPRRRTPFFHGPAATSCGLTTAGRFRLQRRRRTPLTPAYPTRSPPRAETAGKVCDIAVWPADCRPNGKYHRSGISPGRDIFCNPKTRPDKTAPFGRSGRCRQSG